MSLKRDEWPAKAIGFMANQVIEMAKRSARSAILQWCQALTLRHTFALRAVLVSIVSVLMVA